MLEQYVICNRELEKALEKNIYRVFHRFRQAKFDNGGSILSLNQFSLLTQLLQKMSLNYEVVKVTQNNLPANNDLNP